MSKRKTLTTQEAAEQLGVVESTIRRWAKAGKIEGAKQWGRGAHAVWEIPAKSIEGMERAKSGRPPVLRGKP